MARRITVNGIYSGTVLPLHLDGEGINTVQQVKNAIHDETGVEASKQLVLLRGGGGACSYLPNDAVVAGFYPRLNFALFQKVNQPRRTELNIKMEKATPVHNAGEDFTVRISSDATVGRLKKLIDENTAVPPLRQTLKVQFNNGFTLSIGGDQLDEVVLSEIIPDGVRRISLKNASLNPALTVTLTVMVPAQNKEIELSVERQRHTITSVKVEACYRAFKKKKESLRLKNDAGDFLDDGTRTLAQYNVDAGDVLFLV